MTDPRGGNPDVPFAYQTPVPYKMVEPFDRYLGYGDDAQVGGFIPGREHFTPEYMADINKATADLEGSDYHHTSDPNSPFVKRVLELADKHQLNPVSVYWNILNQPVDHKEAWEARPMDPWQKDMGAYNWAFSTDPAGPIGDAAKASPHLRPQPDLRGSQPPPHTQLGPSKTRSWTPEEQLEWVKQHVGTIRTGFEHDMDVDRQVRRAQDRAQEARSRGHHEFADYLDDMAAIMARDAADGRPEAWSHYWPRALEEFGNDHPEVAANPTPRRKSGGVLRHAETTALFYRAYAPPPADVGPPKMDWDAVMDSVKGTGGYTVGDAGESPTSGYMISQPGTEERRPTESVSPHSEDDYHKRHWDQLRGDPDAYQGGWDDDGTFYTDISRNDPNLWNAVGDAVTTDQLGIYDLNRGQTLDTSDDPDTDRDDYNPLLTAPVPMMAFAAIDPQCEMCENQAWESAHENIFDLAREQGMGEQEALAKADAEADAEARYYMTEGMSLPCTRHASARTAGPLQYQDQFDESQYPSPPVDLPERKRRSLERKFKQPAQALDPNALDDRIDIDTLVANALSRYHGATPEQRATGRDWYADARRKLQGLVQATGGDFSKAAAIMASLSPQMDWEGNINAGAHFLNAYNPAEKHKWRAPNLSPAAHQAWTQIAGDRPPSSPHDYAMLSQLAGVDDPDWAKEMAMDGRWDRAAGQATNPKYRHRNNYTGTGLPSLGDNVLRAMNVYDAPDPREVMNYAGGPKIHSFWRNFLGDENYATIDKHMLRALDRPFGSDPLMSYGSGKPEVTRKKTPEDERVAELEKMLSYKRSQKGDEQTVVPTGYNTYAEAIRRATAQANQGLASHEQLTPAQMQAIIWVQHKGDMDAFAKRKAQEAWDARNPGKAKPAPKPYVPALPLQPVPDYTRDDAWHQQNPYKGGEPRPLPVRHQGPSMSPDNIPDVDVTPDLTYVPRSEEALDRAASLGVRW